MTALPGVKYDGGPLSGHGSLSDLPANCFPVRNLLRSSSSNRKCLVRWWISRIDCFALLEQWVVALRDTEQRRFAAILTTLSTPTPFDTNVSQVEMKKRQRWSGKEKTVEHLLDGFFIVSDIDDLSNQTRTKRREILSDASLCHWRPVECRDTECEWNGITRGECHWCVVSSCTGEDLGQRRWFPPLRQCSSHRCKRKSTALSWVMSNEHSRHQSLLLQTVSKRFPS